MDLHDNLFDAISKNDVDRVYLVLRSGADVNSRNGNGNTPLIAATMLNNTRMVELLLAMDADPNLYNNLGFTPLTLGIDNNNFDTVSLLLQSGANVHGVTEEIPILTAVSAENPDILRLLLSYGANPNVAISDAVSTEKDELIDILLQAGAKPEKKAFYTALKRGLIDIALSLQQYATSEDIYKIVDTQVLTPEQAEILSRMLNIDSMYKIIHRVYEAHLHEVYQTPESMNEVRLLIDTQMRIHGEDPNLLEMKNQVFYPTGRPRHSMQFIDTVKKVEKLPVSELVEAEPSNLLIAKLDVGEYTLPLLFRVLRYASGMSGGLYYADTDTDKYCGTFYYYDIGSETYLLSSRTLVTHNKLSAYRLLYPGKNIADIYQKYSAINVFPDLESLDKHSRGEYGDLIDNGKYMQFLYAAEDLLDQPVCKKAKALGYECVILLRMAGRERAVTEILDVRSRRDSFANLYQE